MAVDTISGRRVTKQTTPTIAIVNYHKIFTEYCTRHTSRYIYNHAAENIYCFELARLQTLSRWNLFDLITVQRPKQNYARCGPPNRNKAIRINYGE